MRVEYMLGPNIVQTVFGFLTGVGMNYIVIQELDSLNVSVPDIYSVKPVKIFHDSVDLTSNPSMQQR